MILQEIHQVLIDAFVEKRTILFAGAGISVGSGLPSARELAFQFQNELFKNKFVDVRPSPDDPIQLEVVAQRYQVAFGRQKLNELLVRTFQKEGLTPNDGHKLAVKLFRQIITTNFDTLFEDALRQEGRAPIVVVRDLQLPTTSIPERTVVYKLHGDINTPDRVVITQRDYVRVPLTKGIETELRSMLLTRTVVFIGYRLGDYDFLRQLEFRRSILGEQMPKAYAVMPGADKDPLFVKQCDEDNIDLIADTAIDFLQDLESSASSYVSATPKPAARTEEEPFPEAERDYRAAICDEFKWIDFKGIPVLGGYLKVPIEQLFVSLSAVPQEESDSESGSVTRARDVRKPKLFRKIGAGRSIFEILRENRRAVILGDPGSGKTTLLRYVGYQLSIPEPQPEKIGLEKPDLPVYIPLREYAAFRKHRRREGIESLLPEVLKTHNLGQYVEVVRSALRHGNAIVLLDGLDEVASEEERAEIVVEVQRFATAFAECRLILTSRKVGYSKAPIKNGVGHFVVEPLSPDGINSFIDLWCKATETEKEKQNLIDAIRNPRVRERWPRGVGQEKWAFK